MDRNHSAASKMSFLLMLLMVGASALIGTAAAENTKPRVHGNAAPPPTGTGFFQTPVDYLSGALSGTASVEVADVNDDGKLDLVVGSEALDNSGLIGVLLGNGDGTFQAAQTYSTAGHGVVSTAVADLNGDGRPDVVVTQSEGVAVLLGNGDGTFRTAQTYLINDNGTSAVVIADVNRDGKPDLLLALFCAPNSVDCENGGAAGIMLGNGDGTFQPLQWYWAGAGYVLSIAVADLNHDGNLDLVLADYDSFSGTYDSGVISVLLGNGDGTFRPASTFGEGGFDPGSVTIADLNGDGNPDVVVANQCAVGNCYESTIGVLLGNGDGTFSDVMVDYSTGGYISIAVKAADINGDGIPDLIVGNSCNTKNLDLCAYGTVGLLLGNGDGTFSTSNYSAGGQATTGLAIADLNGDGAPDIVTADECAVVCEDVGVVGVLLSLAPTTTTLASSLNPSIYGQLISFVATVKTAGLAPATGKVTFSWDGYSIGSATLNSSGVATLTKTTLNADIYPLIATYQGDSKDLGSTSSPVLSQVVTQATSSAILTSSPNPSTLGEAVIFTATISSPTCQPKGPVTFMAGKKVLGTANIANGRAKLTTSTLALGSTTVTATFNGDSNVAGSSAMVHQTVE